MLAELVILADEQDIRAITNEYFRLFSRCVETDIREDISKTASWSKMLKAWWSQFRYERNTPVEDAQRLQLAAKGMGTDE